MVHFLGIDLFIYFYGSLHVRSNYISPKPVIWPPDNILSFYHFFLTAKNTPDWLLKTNHFIRKWNWILPGQKVEFWSLQMTQPQKESSSWEMCSRMSRKIIRKMITIAETVKLVCAKLLWKVTNLSNWGPDFKIDQMANLELFEPTFFLRNLKWPFPLHALKRLEFTGRNSHDK